MIVRDPIVAGQFYPERPGRCRSQLTELLAAAPDLDEPGRQVVGGIVPHAGWAYSGAVAGKVFQAVARTGKPDVLVLFGGVHRYRGRQAAMFGSGRWETPLGPVEIDARLAERILGHTNLITDDPYAHESEHSIEVQVPFVKHLFPDARILPIMVPASDRAHEVGQAVARTLASYNYNAAVVGTTDLTHYGPSYGLVEHGVGPNGNAWAKVVNDQRFIDLVCRLQVTELVPEAVSHKNACSSGAAAATLGAALDLAAREARVLEHTTSSEIVARTTGQTPNDSVGYAGVVLLN